MAEITDSPSFVTGSQAYGEPTEKSDIDLVVFVSDSDLAMLVAASGVKMDDREEYQACESASIRFGKLNLIAVADPNYFNAWKRVTQQLVKKRQSSKSPVKRDDAVAAFESAFAEIRRKRAFFETA